MISLPSLAVAVGRSFSGWVREGAHPEKWRPEAEACFGCHLTLEPEGAEEGSGYSLMNLVDMYFWQIGYEAGTWSER